MKKNTKKVIKKQHLMALREGLMDFLAKKGEDGPQKYAPRGQPEISVEKLDKLFDEVRKLIADEANLADVDVKRRHDTLKDIQRHLARATFQGTLKEGDSKMNIAKKQLEKIIKEEIKKVLWRNSKSLKERKAINKRVIKESYVYNKFLVPQQKTPDTSGSGTSQCFQGIDECPPDRLGHISSRNVSGYGTNGDELMADFKNFWSPICNGQQPSGKTYEVYKWVPELPPEQLKKYACEYKQAFAQGLVAHRDHLAKHYPEDPKLENIEKALQIVVGMAPKRPEAVSTPQQRSLKQDKASQARYAEREKANRWMRGQEK